MISSTAASNSWRLTIPSPSRSNESGTRCIVIAGDGRFPVQIGVDEEHLRLGLDAVDLGPGGGADNDAGGEPVEAVLPRRRLSEGRARQAGQRHQECNAEFAILKHRQQSPTGPGVPPPP